jgi:outer membrane receptor protein involved in Fe transport
VVLNHVHSFGPLTVLNLSYGVTRWRTYTRGIAEDFPDFDPIAELGLPDYLRLSGIKASPTYYIYGGYRAAAGQNIGAQAWSVYRNGSEVHHVMATLNRIQGRHEIKFGGETRVNRMNWVQSGVPGGIHTFDFNVTSQYPWWGGGDAMASFLTGVGFGSWGEYEIPPFMSTQSPRYGAFFQDNWRATEKLTIGLGVRYDLELPRTERFNRMNWWDLDLPQAFAAPDPVLPAGLPAGVAPQQDFQNLTGGLVFATPFQRRTASADYNNLGPRVSIAYRLTPRTVLRSGYGLF